MRAGTHRFAEQGVLQESHDEARDTELVLDNGLLVDQRYIENIAKCEVKRKRYFRCQRFGHLA